MNQKLINLFINDIIPISDRIDCTNIHVDLNVLVEALKKEGVNVRLTEDRKFLEVIK